MERVISSSGRLNDIWQRHMNLPGLPSSRLVSGAIAPGPYQKTRQVMGLLPRPIRERAFAVTAAGLSGEETVEHFRQALRPRVEGADAIGVTAQLLEAMRPVQQGGVCRVF